MLELAVGFAGDGAGDLGVGFSEGGGGGVSLGHGRVRLIHKTEDLFQRAFDGIAATAVGRESLADRIGHIPAVGGELAEEANLVRELGVEQIQEAAVVPGHGEDMGAALQEFPGDRLAPEGAEVDAEFCKGIHGRPTGGGSLGGADPRGNHAEIRACLGQFTHQTLGHGTAADISRADKEDGPGGGVLGRSLHVLQPRCLCPAKSMRSTSIVWRGLLDQEWDFP